MWAGRAAGAGWGTPIRPHAGGFGESWAAKLSSTGALQWHTFLGSSDYEQDGGIGVDGSGHVYLAGSGRGTWGSPVNAHSGSGSLDGFVAKMDNDGNLLWNTFIGGSGNEFPGRSNNSVLVDGAGNVYVGGSTTGGFGTPVRPYTSAQDGLVFKLDASGNTLWHTFLGGGANDRGWGLAFGSGGVIHAVGSSDAAWGSPILPHNGQADAYLATLNPDGTLAGHAFVGGSGGDVGFGVAANAMRHIYLTGGSDQTWGDPVRAHTGAGTDAFVAQLFAPLPPVGGFGVGEVQIAGDARAVRPSPSRGNRAHPAPGAAGRHGRGRCNHRARQGLEPRARCR